MLYLFIYFICFTFANCQSCWIINRLRARIQFFFSSSSSRDEKIDREKIVIFIWTMSLYGNRLNVYLIYPFGRFSNSKRWNKPIARLFFFFFIVYHGSFYGWWFFCNDRFSLNDTTHTLYYIYVRTDKYDGWGRCLIKWKGAESSYYYCVGWRCNVASL